MGGGGGKKREAMVIRNGKKRESISYFGFSIILGHKYFLLFVSNKS